MIDKVREQTASKINKACFADDYVLIEAPPASGKTYTSVSLASEGHKVLYLAGRTDLYDEAAEIAAEIKQETDTKFTVETIPSPHRDCETFTDHSGSAKSHAEKLYAMGVSGPELHKDDSDVRMPCQSSGSPCSYMETYRTLMTDPDSVDLLIGNHQHAYNRRYTNDRIVIFDEFNLSAFQTRFTTDSELDDDPNKIIGAFLRNVPEIPCTDVTDLIEARARKDDSYKQTMEWFRTNTADSDTSREILPVTTDKYKISNVLAAFLTCSILQMEDKASGMALAYEPDLWDEVGVHPESRCVRNRNTGEMSVLQPPNLADAQQVIGLDALPVPRLWNTALGTDFELRTVIPRKDISKYLQDGLNLDIIQVTENQHPYSSGRVSPIDNLRFAFARNIAEQPFPLITRKQALESYQGEPWLSECVDSDDQDNLRVKTYGSVLSSNEFENDSVGFISGNPYPGDHVVIELCTLCNEPTEILRDSDSNENEDDDVTPDGDTEVNADGNRAPARGFNISTAFGDEVYRHTTPHQVFQAILRFGRTTDSNTTSTVFVNTAAQPFWLSPRTVTVWAHSSHRKKVTTLEALIQAADSTDEFSWQTVQSLQNLVESRLEQDEHGRTNSISEQTIRNTLQQTAFEDCIERDPNSAPGGADRYQWTGNSHLKNTAGIIPSATHLLVTESRAVFLKRS
jgi:hypothetical protein